MRWLVAELGLSLVVGAGAVLWLWCTGVSLWWLAAELGFSLVVVHGRLIVWLAAELGSRV